jgi:CRP-like cAMP-binding protein
VRAKGEARLLYVDKRGFMKRVHQDPTLAFDILRRMSERIRSLDEEVARLRSPAPEP